MTQISTHENLTRNERERPASERSFGMVMAAVLTIFASANLWREGRIWPWLYAAAVIFALIGFLKPALLKPLNWAWFKLGLVLHAVINPVVMALIFYGAVFPTGVVMRALGKDPLRLKPDPVSDSYWINRQSDDSNMKDQF